MCHTGLSVTTQFCRVLSLSTEKYADLYQQASSKADLSASFQFGMVDRISRLQGLTSTWPSCVLFWEQDIQHLDVPSSSIAGCICPNVTGSTGLHRTSSRSYHTPILQQWIIFSVTLYVALTWLDMELTNMAQFCKKWMGAYLLQHHRLLHLFYFLYSNPVESTLTNSTCPREMQQNNQHTICTHTNRYSTAVSMSSVIKLTIHFINSIPTTYPKKGFESSYKRSWELLQEVYHAVLFMAKAHISEIRFPPPHLPLRIWMPEVVYDYSTKSCCKIGFLFCPT